MPRTPNILQHGTLVATTSSCRRKWASTVFLPVINKAVDGASPTGTGRDMPESELYRRFPCPR